MDTLHFFYCFLLTGQKLDFHQLPDYHASRIAYSVLLGFLDITDAEVEQGAYRHNDEYNPAPLLVCAASTLGACVNHGIPQGSLSVMDQNSSAESANEKTGDKMSFITNCRQLWVMSKAFFASERRLQAIKLACFLLALVLSVAGVQVLLSYVSRDFMTAISK